MHPGLSAITTYLPDTVLTNDVLIERFGFEQKFLTEKLGVTRRHVAATNEGTSDMAASAANKLFATGIVRPDEIDLLIICTQNPDYRLPTTANLVQEKLGLRQNVAAFDINQGCSGFVFGLSVARSMMCTENMRKALFITSESYSKVLDTSDRQTLPLFGDGAAATLIQDEGLGRIGNFVWGSDGTGAKSLMVRGGGGLNPLQAPTGEYALVMDGRAIFNFMMRRVPICVRDCLTANQLTKNDIDLFVFHQASKYMLQNLAKAIDVPLDRVPISIQETGNTVSSSIPMLIDALGGVPALRGKRILVAGFGVGLSWAATVLSF